MLPSLNHLHSNIYICIGFAELLASHIDFRLRVIIYIYIFLLCVNFFKWINCHLPVQHCTQLTEQRVQLIWLTFFFSYSIEYIENEITQKPNFIVNGIHSFTRWTALVKKQRINDLWNGTMHQTESQRTNWNAVRTVFELNSICE